jgi:hypothetical protein
MRTSLPAHVFNHRRWAKTFPLTPRLTEGEFRFVSAQAKLQRCNPDAILRFALQFYMIEMAEPLGGRKVLTPDGDESKQALIGG